MIERVFKRELLWPTPTLTVLHTGVDELNRGLARIVREKEAEILTKTKASPVAGTTKGLTSHWLEYNVLNWNYPEIETFRGMVAAGLREFFAMVGDPDDAGFKVCGISCWANILRTGDSLEVHHHDPSFVSAHYQVQTGYTPDSPKATATSGRDDAGHTVYFRPGFLDRSHGGKQNGMSSPWDSDWRQSVEPVEGKLFFFPSYVRHEVRPYFGTHERISIAMDVFVKKQEALMYFGGPRWHVPK
jgi:hypothetical protein